jgi:hypothetical protein
MPPEVSDLVEKIIEKWNEVPMEYKKKYKENPAELLVINPKKGEFDDELRFVLTDVWTAGVKRNVEKTYEIIRREHPTIFRPFLTALLKYYAYSKTAEIFRSKADFLKGEEKAKAKSVARYCEEMAEWYHEDFKRHYGLDAEKWWEGSHPRVLELAEKIVEKWEDYLKKSKKEME